MLGVKVTIVRYISDDPQPGIIELQLEDAHGRRWSFVEKTAIVSKKFLDDETSYPQQGVIACEVVQRSLDTSGREVIRIDTQKPWYVESVEGVTQFDVSSDLLTEW
jgi:hypothetical protein